MNQMLSGQNHGHLLPNLIGEEGEGSGFLNGMYETPI